MNDTKFINSHNKIAYTIFKKAMRELVADSVSSHVKGQLRSCNAKVYETEHYYILQSYRTFVAAIDKEQNIIVDVLRHEYEYTNTSAMHISKFSYDYLDKTRPSVRFTWRKVK